MKKFYLLMLLFISTTVMGQTPIITMIMDGDCTDGTPKVLEIYAQGTVDFSEYSLENQTNANTAWGNNFNLSGLGVVTNDFVYVYANSANFASEFPNVTNSLSTTSSVMSFNGDDRIRIVENLTSNVIDQYGVDGEDGTGMPWEYTDGYAKRNDNTGPDGLFNASNWTFYKGGVDGQCGTTTYEVISDAGSYTMATGPTVIASPTTLSGFLQFVGTPSAEQTVDVSGMNLTADAVITVTSGDYEISSTTGAGFGNSVILPFGTGTIAPTAIYIRLNGTAAANPSNGELTITSAGATDEVVVLEGEISAVVPTLTVSKTSITGFSHFVGTPSAADSFMVEGFNLTDDITVSVPTNFEVSETLGGTYGASVTLNQSGGAVASTKIYVRLNGPAKNLNQVGDVTISSTDATDQTIALTGETLDYTVSTIGAVTNVDANGVGTSVGDYVTLTGVIHCLDFRNTGYDVVIIDDNNDGITMYSPSNVSGYTNPVEGDKITVQGQIDQFNGLLQISPASITVDATNQTLQTPTSVTVLNEATESQYIQLDNVTLVNNETTWAANTNISVTDGTNTFTVRIPNDSPLAGTSIPSGSLKIVGVGKQFDNSSPYDSGYQLYPCSVTPLSSVGLSDNDFSGITVYPNPVDGVLNITHENGTVEFVEVIAATGSAVYASATSSNNITINTSNLEAGVYFVNVKTVYGVKTYKVIK